MPVIREVARVFWQVLGYSAQSRRPMLWVLVVLGALFVAIAMISALAAPVLIYPVL